MHFLSEAPFHLLLRVTNVKVELDCFNEIILSIFDILAPVKQTTIKNQKLPGQ